MNNYRKTRISVIVGPFFRKQLQMCVAARRKHVGENARAASQIKSGPHPELQPAPDKDSQNAYALAFTVFQISVYLSSRASDV